METAVQQKAKALPDDLRYEDKEGLHDHGFTVTFSFSHGASGNVDVAYTTGEVHEHPAPYASLSGPDLAAEEVT